MKVTLFSLFLIFLASSCAPKTYQVESSRNERRDYSITEMQNNLLAGGSDSVQVYLDAKRMSLGEDLYYTLVVRYVGQEWLHIKSGESLILFLDDERLSFTGDGSVSDRSKSLLKSEYTEQASYEVTLAELNRIADAANVRVEVVGENHSAERHFSEENLQRLYDFLKSGNQ